jgi:hypothetical protein
MDIASPQWDVVMPSSFVTKIEAVRRRQQRRRLLAALCWALAASGIAALTLIALDRALGIQDVLGRVLWTAGFVACCVLIIRKWLVKELSQPITSYDVAQRVEVEHPELRDIVTSGLEFSGQSETDPWAGSSSLRHAVVLRAASGVEDVDWQQLAPRRPLQRSLYAIAAVSLLASGFAWWAPQSLAIGVTRLLNPLSTAEWPRIHDLQFAETPHKLATGDDLVLELRDTHGSLPTELTMHYRHWLNGRWQEETEPLVSTGPSVSVRRANLQESLQYRATGGDHLSMPWQKLEVVMPPHVSELQITARPPSYTGLSASTLTERGRVLINSELQLRGKVDQPLANISLQSESGQKWPLALAADRQSFHLPKDSWRAGQSDTFSLQLTTMEALTTKTKQLLALEVVPDEPPEVRFEQPLQDLTVVPTAEVPLAVTAHDDLAVQHIELVYRRSDRSQAADFRLPLLRGPNGVEDPLAQRKRQVDFLWQLAPLELEQGSVVEIHARANDYQPASGQTSHPLRLTVVSSTEMYRRITERETQVLDEIEQLVRGQRALRDNTTEWTERPEGFAERWASQGHDALYRQRQIAARLVENSDAVLRQLAAIQADIRRNQLQRPETDERLYDLQLALRQLAEGPLPTLESAFGNLIRRAETNSLASERQSLVSEIAGLQDQVIVALEQARTRLALGEQLGHFERELRAISTEQVELEKQCTELAASLLQNGGVAEVIADLASEQRQLARRLAKLMQRMSSASERLTSENPAVASRVDLTVGLAHKLGVQATMIQAADQINARRLGRASPLQRQAALQLQKLLSQLIGQDAASTAAQIQKLEEAQHQLVDERRRQQVALARLEMAQLDAQLAGFENRQTAVLDELKRLDALRQIAGRFTTAEEQSVTLLAEAQDVLRAEIVEQSGRIESLPVFAHLLRTAAQGMQQVSNQLRQQATGDLAQQGAQEVLEQLRLLSEAVKQESKKLSDDADQGGGAGGQPGNSAQAQSLQVALGQLKLLKSLQLALQQRTRALESKLAAGRPMPEEILAEARKLAAEQQQLTRAAEQLQPEPTDPPPDRLFPNLDQELEQE